MPARSRPEVVAGGQPPTLPALISFVPGVLVSTVYVVVAAELGEEVGWRGYALPALQARYRGADLQHHSRRAVGLVAPAAVLQPRGGSYSDLPFALYEANVIPFTILITWLFNSARGSVLIIMILHGVMNASGELLKAVPEFSTPPATTIEAAAETGQIYLLLTVVLAIAATLVVLIHGPRDLSRRPRQTSPSSDRPEQRR